MFFGIKNKKKITNTCFLKKHARTKYMSLYRVYLKQAGIFYSCVFWDQKQEKITHTHIFQKNTHTHKVHIFIQSVSKTGGHILFMCFLGSKTRKNHTHTYFLKNTHTHTHKVHIFIQSVSKTGGHILFMCFWGPKRRKKIIYTYFLKQIAFALVRLPTEEKSRQ